ncbi:MAG: DMT family transporter [Clostridiales bacterium]|nr:DMT family transporter [Clostridiales bacterium]
MIRVARQSGRLRRGIGYQEGWKQGIMKVQAWTDRHKYLLGAVLSVSGGAMWGVSGTCGQFLFTRKGLSCLWLTPIRLFLAGILLLAWCFCKDFKTSVQPWKNKRDCMDLFLYGLADRGGDFYGCCGGQSAGL